MAAARRHGASPCVTIFVNPTQFGPNEDFGKYPRTLESDLEICRAEGVEVVFAPDVDGMYPKGECTRVSVARLTEGLCGASRPGHFDGVTTIVTKLFALAGPCHAFFGRKDYQQLRVIQRMATDLMLPVEVIGCPIVREPDGLALSSRNRYLSKDERARALCIVRGLIQADQAYRGGERKARALVELVRGAIGASALREDYVELRVASDLSAVEGDVLPPTECALLVAAFCGTTRLIDNVILGADVLPTSGAMS
jgi:pantoate--beta-alanine ligase